MVDTARSVVVILNTRSGNRDANTDAIVAAFRAVDVEAQVVAIQEGQQPADVAREALAGAGKGRTVVLVAAGGDGTVNGVASVVVGTDAVLGILPLGTLNHFAKDLHIPLELEASAAVIARGRIVRVDAARANDRVFVNNSSIGAYPTLVALREDFQKKGHRKWLATARAMIALPRHYRGVPVRISVGDRESTCYSPFVLVGNNEYTVDGLSFGTRASIDAARLLTYLAPRLRLRDLPLLLIRALLGRSRTAGFAIIDAPELRVQSFGGRRMPIVLDGELTTLEPPVHFRTWPGALLVCVPDA